MLFGTVMTSLPVYSASTGSIVVGTLKPKDTIIASEVKNKRWKIIEAKRNGERIALPTEAWAKEITIHIRQEVPLPANQFARIRHDTVARTDNKLAVYPATRPMQNEPKGTGKGVVIPIVPEWDACARSLNSETSNNWLFATGTMWINIEAGEGEYQKAESIACNGNVVNILMQTPSHALIEHFHNDAQPPAGMTHESHPHLIHKVTCTRRADLAIVNPASGKDIHFPIFTRGGINLYLPLATLEPFPDIPRLITTISTIPIFSSAGGEQVGVYNQGKDVIIYEYKPMASDVWARTEIGWIQLQKNRTFFTSWTMATQPPVPKVHS